MGFKSLGIEFIELLDVLELADCVKWLNLWKEFEKLGRQFERLQKTGILSPYL